MRSNKNREKDNSQDNIESESLKDVTRKQNRWTFFKVHATFQLEPWYVLLLLNNYNNDKRLIKFFLIYFSIARSDSRNGILCRA